MEYKKYLQSRKRPSPHPSVPPGCWVGALSASVGYPPPGRLKGQAFPIIVSQLDLDGSDYLTPVGVEEVVEVMVTQLARDLSLAR